MHTLPKEIATLEEVHADLKTLYVPKEGGGGFVFKDISGMQNAFVETKTKLQTATATIAQLNEANAAWNGLGMKPEEVKTLIATKAEIDAAKNGLPQEIQQIKTQLAQTYEGQVNAAKTEAKNFKGFIETSVRQDAVKSALIAAGARPDRLPQLTKLALDDVSVVWDPSTGQPRAAVLKPDGMPMLNPETGDEMKPADIIAKYKKDMPELFQANAGSGTGANGQNVQAPTEGDPRAWTTAQQRAYAKQHGEAALQQLIINAAKTPKAAA